MVNLVAERAEIDRDFDPSDEENLNCDRVIMCVEPILSLFNVSYISERLNSQYYALTLLSC